MQPVIFRHKPRYSPKNNFLSRENYVITIIPYYKYNYFIYNAWVENICDLNVLSTLQQMKARQNVNMIATQKAIMSMWKKDSESKTKINGAVEDYTESVDNSVNLDQLLMYIDRMRFRKPGTGSKLTPHLDSGSITRWSDPIYRC